MDLSIVILNWKVKDLLHKCLTSIFKYTNNLTYEVIVVDNDSNDGSPEMIRREFPQVLMIQNSSNLGFAAGNNPGLKVAKGKFILLLNPDTEIHDNSFLKLVEEIRTRPEVGVMGPKLLNPDGSLQSSVRSFPRLTDQLLIMLKLHRIFPHLRSLRRYLREDFDYNKPSEVDQIMGAAFLVRREIFEKIGYLDEDYFIWFEEVDFCKRVQNLGKTVNYTPLAEVVHYGGESFAQEFGPTKQRFWNSSVRIYLRKHIGFFAWLVATLFHPISMFLAWGVQLFSSKKFYSLFNFKLKNSLIFSLLIFLFLNLELLSWIGYNIAWVNLVVYSTIIILFFLLTWFKPGIGLLAILTELILGSQGGYEFTIGPANVESATLSLRMGLFLVVFGVWVTKTLFWLVSSIRLKKGFANNYPSWLIELKRTKLLWPYLGLLIVLVWSSVRGVINGNSLSNIFFDANGYAFLVLFPAVIEGWRELSKWPRALIYTLVAAMIVSVFKSLVVLYFFSHRLYEVAANMYLWIRDTRVGEVALMTADFHRVFFQSHLFVLVSFFALVLLTIITPNFIRNRRFWVLFSLLTGLGSGLVLGLSRSFWFGGFVGLIVLLFLLFKANWLHRLWKKLIAVFLLTGVTSVMLVAIVYVFPFPNKTGDISLVSLLSGRATSFSGEAAANSRWSLLPELWKTGIKHPFLGSGLGTEVTYVTSDPRLLVDNPTGEYTTYAFEWGYLDIWIKLGVLGLGVYGWLVWSIVRLFMLSINNQIIQKRSPEEYLSFKDKYNLLLLIGAVAGIAALLGTHLFSPYLNHPLGLGVLMFLAAWGISISSPNVSQNKE